MLSKGKIFIGIVLAILGIILSARPLGIINFLNFIVGIAIILTVLVTMTTRKEDNMTAKKTVAMIIGAVEIVIGVWMLFNPAILILGLSILFILNGIRKSIEIVTVPTVGKTKLMSLILALLNLGIAVFIYYNFTSALELIFKAIGYFLLIMGVLETVQGIILKDAGY